ncbi:MAG: glycosyltransferase [Bdellovibrionaceae bacterium]|nr:glycosyltransferase [Pseudobdellovibrionaceae bacterium]
MNHDRRITFAVALPVYNEQTCVAEAVITINEVLNEIPFETKIIAVNDGSKDRSLEILKSLLTGYPRLIIVNHPINRGYGGACLSALEKGHQEKLTYVLYMDCDLTQDPKYIKDFIEKMQQGYALIKGSRYINGGKVEGVPYYRKFLSSLGNFVAGLFWRLPIKDFTNGFRAIRTDTFELLQLKERGFSILMEEIYCLSYFTKNFSEVPYILTVREDNQGTSSFSYSYKVFYSYLKYPILSFLKIKPAYVNDLKPRQGLVDEN